LNRSAFNASMQAGTAVQNNPRHRLDLAGARDPSRQVIGQVLAFLRTQLVPGEPIRARQLARLILEEFGLDVHPRTVERAVSGKKLCDSAGRDREVFDSRIRCRRPV
jgi:hypothetical protein